MNVTPVYHLKFEYTSVNSPQAATAKKTDSYCVSRIAYCV